MEDKIPVPAWKRVLKPAIAAAIPLALLPIPIFVGTEASWSAYVTLWMSAYYIVEPVPLSVTSLLPIALFPFLGILSTDRVATMYLNDTGILFMASLMIATAIESSELHERLAFKCLLIAGTSEKMVLLGLMFITVFMSMWMPNTAIATIMAPIVFSIAQRMSASTYQNVETNGAFLDDKKKPNGNSDSIEISFKSTSEIAERDYRFLSRMMLLGVAYSSNIGGTGTIIGSSTNILFKGILDEQFPESTRLTSATWMMYNIPPMIVCTICAWLYIQFLMRKRATNSTQNNDEIRREIQEQYDKKGPFSFAEFAVMMIVVIVVLLLFFEKPQFMTGWSDLIPWGRSIKSSTPAITICFLLFVLPKDPKNVHSSEPLVSFKDFSQKMPWGIVLLFGGCLALAEASKKSGLSALIIDSLTGLKDLPPVVVLVVICYTGCLLTEAVSTYVITGVMTPIVAEMAVALKVNPYYFLMPMKASCLFAFMLPIATGANAIICDMGKFRSIQMLKYGWPMNLVCVLIQVIAINTIGIYIFDLNNFPGWAARDLLPQHADEFLLMAIGNGNGTVTNATLPHS